MHALRASIVLKPGCSEHSVTLGRKARTALPILVTVRVFHCESDWRPKHYMTICMLLVSPHPINKQPFITSSNCMPSSRPNAKSSRLSYVQTTDSDSTSAIYLDNEYVPSRASNFGVYLICLHAYVHVYWASRSRVGVRAQLFCFFSLFVHINSRKWYRQAKRCRLQANKVSQAPLARCTRYFEEESLTQWLMISSSVPSTPKLQPNEGKLMLSQSLHILPRPSHTRDDTLMLKYWFEEHSNTCLASSLYLVLSG